MALLELSGVSKGFGSADNRTEVLHDINLSIEEANLILAALGNLPFSQVNGLIAKLHGQANKQLQAISAETEKVQPLVHVKENGR